MEPARTSSSDAGEIELAVDEGTIEVPEAAVVQCPLAGYDLRPVLKCPQCPKFGGLEDRFPGSPAPFAKRYTLRCFGEPVRRPMLMLAKDGD